MGLVVAFLVGSFAIWGIGDIFRGFGLSRLAKVGSTEIGIEQFRQLYSDRLRQIGQRIGRPLTQDQARAFGIDRQILGDYIAETSLDERARSLRLGVSDAELSRTITADPTFKGPDGRFDPVRFQQLIRQIGYSEPAFVAEQRRNLMRGQIIGAVTEGVSAPKTAVDVVNRFQNEQRSIDYVALGPAQAGDVPAPTPEELAKYFEERKTLFRAPEYRKLTVVSLTPPDMAKWMEISDEEARQTYDENRTRYITPERRHIEQIVFPNADEARAAADKLAQGTSFEALATERGLKEQDIDLGSVTKAGMIDPAIADAAFALKEGDTSAPVQGRFGTALVHVIKVEPEQVRPYEQVAAEIKRDLAQQKAKSQVLDLHDKIEDARAGGDSLAEAAQKLKVEARTIEAVDRSGRAPDGTPVAGLPPGVDILSGAFASDVGVDNDPLQAEGGFVWYDVAAITPSHERPLDEVKPLVEASWHNDQVADRLKKKADEILQQLKTGGNLADVAGAQGLKVETASGIKRNAAAPGLSARAVEQVFKTPKGDAASTQGDQATQQIVFRVTDSKVPPLDPASLEAKPLVDNLRTSLMNDLYAQYVTRVQSDIGVSINQAALDQIVGGATP